jgi:hypothetical protein
MTSLKFSIKIELLDFGQITYLISVNAIASVSPSRRLASEENNTGWRRTRVAINLNNGS